MTTSTPADPSRPSFAEEARRPRSWHDLGYRAVDYSDGTRVVVLEDGRVVRTTVDAELDDELGNPTIDLDATTIRGLVYGLPLALVLWVVLIVAGCGIAR